MPRLYCEEHGREQEADTSRNQELYRQEGESVLIVKGRLISGPWRCDRCNATLTKGTLACLLTAFPGWMTESMYDYDFAYERKYFGKTHDGAAVYGAAWPDTVLRSG
jgi:hypothetical protein